MNTVSCGWCHVDLCFSCPGIVGGTVSLARWPIYTKADFGATHVGFNQMGPSHSRSISMTTDLFREHFMPAEVPAGAAVPAVVPRGVLRPLTR